MKATLLWHLWINFSQFLVLCWVIWFSWRRQWQPTSVLLPGESHGQRSLLGYSPQCHKDSDMTEATGHTAQWLPNICNGRSRPRETRERESQSWVGEIIECFGLGIRGMWAWSQYIPPSYTGVSHTNLLECLSAFQLKKKKRSLVTNDFQNSLIVLAWMVSGSP